MYQIRELSHSWFLSVFRFYFLKIYFLCLNILLARVSVYHMHAKCPQRSKEDMGSRGTGVVS